MQVRDEYAVAVRADDLSDRRRACEVLAAAGMAGQRHGLGMALQRLRADPSEVLLRQVAEELGSRLREAVRRREVRRDGVDAYALAHHVVRWWVDPTCLACSGVKFVAANGRLTSRACKACGGAGVRGVDSPAPAAAQWVLDLLAGQVAMSEGALRRRCG